MGEVRQTRGERLLRRARVPLGFVFAAAFLGFARPTVRSLLSSAVLVVPGLWLRGYAAGYVRKNAELTQTGPYAHTRNPLYLGSLCAALGFVAAGRRGWLLLAFVLLFTAIYVPVIRSEERFLRGTFAGFEEYCRRVPRLFPTSFRRRVEPGGNRGAGHFSVERYRQHREYDAAMGAGAVYAALALLLFLRERGLLGRL